MHVDEVEHRMKFNVSASLLDAWLLRDDTVFPFFFQKLEK
jgi:hypothetical protein